LSTGFFNSAESAVTYAATAMEIILLVRLARLGLIREFKFFWLFLAYDAVRTLALSGWDYHLSSYEQIWVVTAPVWTILLGFVSLELLRGLAQPIPRERANRTFALYGFLIGMTASTIASMLAHPQAILRSSHLLLMIGRRCILSGCILAILAQAVFLAFGGAPLIANWRWHRRVLLVFLTALVIGSFVGTLPNTQLIEGINLLRGVALLVCYCAWIPMFERAWSRLQSYSTFPSASLSEETLAEIFAYRAREARHSKASNALPAISQYKTSKISDSRYRPQ
jgi:hypothetical protein